MAYPRNATAALAKVMAKTCQTTGLEASEGEGQQVGEPQLYAHGAGIPKYDREGSGCLPYVQPDASESRPAILFLYTCATHLTANEIEDLDLTAWFATRSHCTSRRMLTFAVQIHVFLQPRPCVH